jgi:hypothetical protein
MPYVRAEIMRMDDAAGRAVPEPMESSEGGFSSESFQEAATCRKGLTRDALTDRIDIVDGECQFIPEEDTFMKSWAAEGACFFGHCIQPSIVNGFSVCRDEP